MVRLYNQATGEDIGTISEQQLQFLIGQMEEESMEDQDYAITKMTLDYLETSGADSELINLLRSALSGRDEVTVRWSEA